MLRVFIILIAIVHYAVAIDDILTVDELLKYAPKKEESQQSQSQYPASSKQDITIEDLKMVAPTDEPDLNVSDEAVYENIRVNDLLLRTADTPKSVYINQIFKMDIRADVQQNIDLDLNLTVEKSNELKWLNQENLVWLKGERGLFDTTLWFEANSTKAALNGITVVLNKNGEFLQKATIKPRLPKLKILEERKNFSHIVSDGLKIKSYKTATFDDTANLMTIDFEVKNGDLASFYINNDKLIKQGVDSVRGDFTNQRGYYFAIVDKNLTKLDFSYFNLRTNKFENYSLDVRPQTNDLSTQIGLNPKESKFKEYKAIAIYGLAALLLVMFIISKNLTPLFVGFLLLGIQFYTNQAYAKGTLKENTLVRILPIKNSTVFYISTKPENVEIFDENGKYYKILLSSGKIGWVLEDDVSQN